MQASDIYGGQSRNRTKDTRILKTGETPIYGSEGEDF